MADKVWTATDIEQGTLTIMPVQENKLGQNFINIQRRYKFLDGVGDVLTDIAVGRLVVDVLVADIPAGVLSALQTIDAWTENAILVKEGMGGS